MSSARPVFLAAFLYTTALLIGCSSADDSSTEEVSEAPKPQADSSSQEMLEARAIAEEYRRKWEAAERRARTAEEELKKAKALEERFREAERKAQQIQQELLEEEKKREANRKQDEWLLLTEEEQNKVREIEQKLRTSGFVGLNISEVRYAYSGRGRLFLGDELRKAAESGTYPQPDKIAEILGLNLDEKLMLIVLTPPGEWGYIQRLAEKLVTPGYVLEDSELESLKRHVRENTPLGHLLKDAFVKYLKRVQK